MLHKISVEKYFEIAEGLHTELLKGIIFDKMPKSQLHINFLILLTRLLRKELDISYEVMSENPLALADSAPEPDIAIINQIESLDAPRITNAYLAIEISVTTKAYDAAKAEIYAEAEIPVYWQILPLEKLTIIYTEPHGGKYQNVKSIPFTTPLALELPKQTFEVKLNEIR